MWRKWPCFYLNTQYFKFGILAGSNWLKPSQCANCQLFVLHCTADQYLAWPEWRFCWLIKKSTKPNLQILWSHLRRSTSLYYQIQCISYSPVAFQYPSHSRSPQQSRKVHLSPRKRHKGSLIETQTPVCIVVLVEFKLLYSLSGGKLQPRPLQHSLSDWHQSCSTTQSDGFGSHTPTSVSPKLSQFKFYLRGKPFGVPGATSQTRPLQHSPLE